MKLLLCFALLVSVTVLNAYESEEWDNLGHDLGGSYDSFDENNPEDPVEPEVPGEDDDDEGNYNGEEDEDEDEDEDEVEDADVNDSEDEDEDYHPTPEYPRRRRWPGLKCLLKARQCFKNSTECSDYLACYEEKSRCMQAAKKQNVWPVKKPTTICKSNFSKCMGSAGSDCFKKYMCYTKKSMCYRSRRGRRPRHHRRRPHHHRHGHGHHRRPTMCPKMLKCKMEWKKCFMRANTCSKRLECMYEFHDCMNRSRPTSPPLTMSAENDKYGNEYRRRWNPKLRAKCKEEFHECINNATSCPLKLRCFWRMKMCFMSHRRRGFGGDRMVMKRFNRVKNHFHRFGKGMERTVKPKFNGMRNRFEQTGREWFNRGVGMGMGMGNPYGGHGRQWGNREMGSPVGGNREMGNPSGGHGIQWGNRRMGSGNREMRNPYGEQGRQWENREMGSRVGGHRRRGKSRGQGLHYKFKRIMKNIWQG